MNEKLLRSIMVLYGDTNKTLGAYLNVTEQTISAKINENGTEFKQSEIALIQKRYNLTPEQVMTIFFN